jgi:galactokinase/mevalonate kinase-like predicted kinase
MIGMNIVRTVKCPIRIDIGGGSLDIQPIPTEMGPVSIVAAAIDKYVTGAIYTDDKNRFTVKYWLDPDINTGSGLGTSGAMNACWLALVSGNEDRYKLASDVYSMEQSTGVVGGVQDQYMSALGGVRRISMSGRRVWCDILLGETAANRYLLPHLMLVNTGIVRSATNMNGQFLDRYMHGELHQELMDLSEVTDDLANRLGKLPMYYGEPLYIESIGDLIDTEWIIRKKLMPTNVTEIDSIINMCKLKFGGIHARSLGASGGGCILFFLEDHDIYGKLTKFIHESTKCKVIPFSFDYNGLMYNVDVDNNI